MARIVAPVGQGRVKPSEYFNPIAQQISRSPATNNQVHAMDSFSVPT